MLVSRRRELIEKWTTWLLIAPVVGMPVWIGRGPTAALAAALAVVAVMEYVRLVKLSGVDTVVLLGLAVLYPLAAWLRPSMLGLAPIVVLACSLPSVLSGDVEHGGRRTAFTGFGSVWICWSLAHLVMLWPDTFLVAFAASAADVAAWCGGKGLRRFRWARKPLSPLSPNKTVGGMIGAFIGAFLVLTLLGTISIGLLIAVAFGDLLESMVKRQAKSRTPARGCRASEVCSTGSTRYCWFSRWRISSGERPNNQLHSEFRWARCVTETPRSGNHISGR